MISNDRQKLHVAKDINVIDLTTSDTSKNSHSQKSTATTQTQHHEVMRDTSPRWSLITRCLEGTSGDGKISLKILLNDVLQWPQREDDIEIFADNLLDREHIAIYRRVEDSEYYNTTGDGYCFGWTYSQLMWRQRLLDSLPETLHDIFPCLREHLQKSADATRV